MKVLMKGSTGSDVIALQRALLDQGFNPGRIDGDFGQGVENALRAFQRSEGLLDDGIAGPRTLERLFGGAAQDLPAVSNDLSLFTPELVSKMFPFTPISNIRKNLPGVLTALAEYGMTDKRVVLMALATVRAEVESFQPVKESKSKYNTSPNGHDFDLYDNRKDLGNRGRPDGSAFAGRGYVQLTGRYNYDKFGRELGIDLINNPDLASDAVYAGRLLVLFIKSKEVAIKQALIANDLRTARRLVNGGSHGIDRFSDAYRRGARLVGA